MRIRGYTVEYNLVEAARMLGLSSVVLKRAVDTGHLRCYYRLGKNNYQFHEASLRTNQELLTQKGYLDASLPAEVTTGPGVRAADPPSRPSG